MNSILVSFMVILSVGMVGWVCAEVAKWLDRKMRPLNQR